MSRDGYLPPGVEYSDLPGNRPEDAAWEAVHERIDNDAAGHHLSDMDVEAAWLIGLAAFNAAKTAGALFPYESQPLPPHTEELRAALTKIAFEPFGRPDATDAQVLDAITEHAREVLSR